MKKKKKIKAEIKALKQLVFNLRCNWTSEVTARKRLESALIANGTLDPKWRTQ
jgi:hypothetical protein